MLHFKTAYSIWSVNRIMANAITIDNDVFFTLLKTIAMRTPILVVKYCLFQRFCFYLSLSVQFVYCERFMFVTYMFINFSSVKYNGYCCNYLSLHCKQASVANNVMERPCNSNDNNNNDFISANKDHRYKNAIIKNV